MTEKKPVETGQAAPGTAPGTPPAAPHGLRQRFAALPRAARWGIIVAVIVAAYLLPYLDRIPLIGPQIVTQGIDWPSALFNASYFVLLALGLNVVVGYAGLLDL